MILQQVWGQHVLLGAVSCSQNSGVLPNSEFFREIKASKKLPNSGEISIWEQLWYCCIRDGCIRMAAAGMAAAGMAAAGMAAAGMAAAGMAAAGMAAAGMAAAGMAAAGMAAAGMAAAGIAAAVMAAAGMPAAGSVVADIATAGISAAGVLQQFLRRQFFRLQDALSKCGSLLRARWRHAICAFLQIVFVLCAICISCLSPIFLVSVFVFGTVHGHICPTHVQITFKFIIQIYKLSCCMCLIQAIPMQLQVDFVI
jgi:hypothetical protein